MDTRLAILEPGQCAVVRRASPRDAARAAAPGNFFFDHPQLSKDHAAFTFTKSGLVLTDRCSSFGTLLNGQFLVPGADVPVRSGDRVGFIVVKSVRFITDVVSRHPGPLIPLDHFNDPDVVLRFDVELTDADGCVGVRLVPQDFWEYDEGWYEEDDVDLSYATEVASDDDVFSMESEPEDPGSEAEPESVREEFSLSDLDDDSDSPVVFSDSDAEYLLSDSEIDQFLWDLTRKPATPWYKTLAKEVAKGSLYVVGTIVVLGIYGSRQVV